MPIMRNSLKYILPLLIVQLSFIIWFWPGFLTDWDSYLYTYAGLTFSPVTLASGRWLFAVLLGVIWQIVNLFRTIPPDYAWLIFSSTTIIFALLNVVLFFTLAQRLIGRDSALIATAIFVTSPLIAISSSAVMTETYTISALLISILLILRAKNIFHIILAGLSFGLACAIREPIIFMIFLPVGIILSEHKNKKSIFAFITAMIFVLLINQAGAYLTTPNRSEIYAHWLAGMASERAKMVPSIATLLIRNTLFLVCWLVIFSPLIVLTISKQISVLRKEQSYWHKPAMLAIIAYLIAEIANHSLIFNPRFVIFPAIILTLFAADAIKRTLPLKFKPVHIATMIVLLQISLIFLSKPIFQKYYFDKSQAARKIFFALKNAPKQAVFIPGKFTPLIEFYSKLHQRNWRIVYSGWDFSNKKLSDALSQAKKENMPVYLVDKRYFPDKRYRGSQYRSLSNLMKSYRGKPTAIPFFRILLDSG